MTLGLTQPLTRKNPWDKGGRCIRLTIYHLYVPIKIFFVLFHQVITVYRCLLMDATLKNPRTVGLCNLNTTYHFLGSRQTAGYGNCSNWQFKYTPLYSYCSQLANYLNSILPLTHTQQLKLNTLKYYWLSLHIAISLTYPAFSSR
jgi:hypothetical protein